MLSSFKGPQIQRNFVLGCIILLPNLDDFHDDLFRRCYVDESYIDFELWVDATLGWDIMDLQ